MLKISISNCHKNIMGTVSFDGQFLGMRKAQDFIVYPMQDSGTTIKVQSKTRIGTIDLFNGVAAISKSYPNGAYNVHLQAHKLDYQMVSAEDCMILKGWIKSTGGVEVGESIVLSDNTGAIAL